MDSQFYTLFASVVIVLRNQQEKIDSILSYVSQVLSKIASDYEIILIDNASSDDSAAILKRLTEHDGLANLQVYVLTKEVSEDIAYWIGIENSLGDFAVVIDPLNDDIGFLRQMLEESSKGAEVVFASNTKKLRQGFAYNSASAFFNKVYQKFTGIDLNLDAPPYRLISRRVINYILQHPRPWVSYRHLPASGGFTKANLTYAAEPLETKRKKFIQSLDRGSQLLVSTTNAPMRLVTYLCLTGAFSNIIYSLYVVGISFFKSDVAPGWVSTSLQLSGMFFLISLVLLVLSEYLLQITSVRNEGPLYHVKQEFTSDMITYREKLNVEDSSLVEDIQNTQLS